MSKVYIVCDTNNAFAVGNSLEQAFKNYKNDVDWEEDNENLAVFEAEEIEVEFKVVKKEVPTKVINKKSK